MLPNASKIVEMPDAVPINILASESTQAFGSLISWASVPKIGPLSGGVIEAANLSTNPFSSFCCGFGAGRGAAASAVLFVFLLGFWGRQGHRIITTEFC